MTLRVVALISRSFASGGADTAFSSFLGVSLQFFCFWPFPCSWRRPLICFRFAWPCVAGPEQVSGSRSVFFAAVYFFCLTLRFALWFRLAVRGVALVYSFTRSFSFFCGALCCLFVSGIYWRLAVLLNIVCLFSVFSSVFSSRIITHTPHPPTRYSLTHRPPPAIPFPPLPTSSFPPLSARATLGLDGSPPYPPSPT